jgi:hypothetical protein
MDNNNAIFDLEDVLNFQLTHQEDKNNTPEIEENQQNINPSSTDEIETTKDDLSIKDESLENNKSEESDNRSTENPLNTYFEFLKDQGLIVTEDDYKFDGKEDTLEELKDKTINFYKAQV